MVLVDGMYAQGGQLSLGQHIPLLRPFLANGLQMLVFTIVNTSTLATTYIGFKWKMGHFVPEQGLYAWAQRSELVVFSTVNSLHTFP